MSYFGKPRQCYRCHILAVYASWKSIYERRKFTIESICQRLGVNLARFRAASLTTVAFHDGGKPSRSFQAAMSALARKNGWRDALQCRTCQCSLSVVLDEEAPPAYRHEIIGGLMALAVGQSLDRDMGSSIANGFPFEFLSVIGHHKPVTPQTFSRELNEFLGRSDELERIGFGLSEWHHVNEVGQALFEQEGLSWGNHDWSVLLSGDNAIIERVKEQIDGVPLETQKVIDSTGSTQAIGTIREIHALLKSMLIAADWEGSSDLPIHGVMDLSVSGFWNKVKTEVEKTPDMSFNITPFQSALGEHLGHGLALAPTGAGKTEAAIAWALRQKAAPGWAAGKILYVLPTQVLTNSIYERLATYLGKDNVGLLHSGALLYQMLSRSETSEHEQYDPAEIKPTSEEQEVHTLNRMMFRPVMVATVDQLLLLAFNGNKRWAVIFGELLGGMIIFDEVHAYDGHMLALLERVSRELRDHTRFLFMSATMPTALQVILKKLAALPEGFSPIEDNRFVCSARNRWHLVRRKKSACPLLEDHEGERIVVTEVRQIVSDSLARGKRILVVCNTVQASQDAYRYLKKTFHEELSDDDIMCLHSRFIAKDRRTKEKCLLKDRMKSREHQKWPRLMIATQVVECGLDLDYDVLLTEGAPLEALIQRAGRINRDRRPEPGDIYLFRQDEASQKFYPPELVSASMKGLTEILQANALLTEGQFTELVEKIYAEKHFEDDLRFQNTRRVLEELMYDVGAIQDLPETDLHTRFVTYKLVDVVPETFWNEIKDKGQFTIMDHLVKMPLWTFLQSKSADSTEDWKVMRMDYNSEVGGVVRSGAVQKEVVFA